MILPIEKFFLEECKEEAAKHYEAFLLSNLLKTLVANYKGAISKLSSLLIFKAQSW